MLSTRSARLDILRAVAVLLVVIHHLEPAPTTGPLAFWHRGGWMGVDLFFVLSGFLVSGLLFRDYQQTGRIRAGRFLLRRGLKIYPAFWVFMLMTAAVFGGRIPLGAYFIELAFVQNYRPAIWQHTWSLAVEEHFYLLLTLVFVWLSRRRADDPFAGLPRVIIGVCIVTLAMRTYTALSLWPNLSVAQYLFPTHLRIDALACGVGLSHAYHFHRAALLDWARRQRARLMLVGLLLVCPPFLWQGSSWLLPSVGLTGLYLGCAALVLALLTLPEPTHWTWRGLAYVGANSYSIYLWHIPINIGLGDLLSGHQMLYRTVYPLAAIAAGIVMARLVEFPILRLRDRYWPASAQGSVSPLSLSIGQVV